MTREELDKSHLSDITLPDVDTKEVHLLIGQDNPSLLIPKEVRVGGIGAPYAARTILGWILNGPVGTEPFKPVTSHFCQHGHQSTAPGCTIYPHTMETT